MVIERGLAKTAGALLLVAALGLASAAAADFEVTGPDGRRILLKDDGTWRYVGEKDRKAGEGKPAEKPKAAGEALLHLERRQEAEGGCRFAVRLANNFPYLIESFIPTFSAVRSNGVAYDSKSAAFSALKPGDTQTREIQFRGIDCQEIARLQVSGGDRCVMGDLDRFAPADGQCLARIRVLNSNLVRFDK